MTPCTNCGTTLTGEFCHACGQIRFVESDRRFGHLLQQFVASATDLDGRFWSTFRALAFQPGLLSREYFEGRRARWISPVSLFLAVSVVYFVAPSLGGVLTLQFNQQVSGHVRQLALGPDETVTEQQAASTGQYYSPLTARWIEQRVRQRDEAARSASAGASGYSYRDYRLAYDAKANDVSKALVILHVPIAALALLLMFAGQRRYYAEHFVFALHYLSFWMLSLQVVLQHGRQQAGRRGGDEGVRWRMLLDLGEQPALQLHVLRDALLDEVGVPNRLVELGREPHVPARTGRVRQLRPRSLGVVEHLADATLGVGMWVEDDDVETVLDQPACPAAADDTATD